MEKDKAFFTKIKKDWVVCSMDANSQVGGLLDAWNPKKASFSVYGISLGIYLNGKILDFAEEVN